MSFDSTYIDSSLFSDLMELRILVERECVRLACAKHTPGKLDTLRRHTDAIYAADEEAPLGCFFVFEERKNIVRTGQWALPRPLGGSMGDRRIKRYIR